MKEDLARWIAWHLPWRVVYYAVIRVWCFATTGPCINVEAADVTIADAVREWEKVHRE